MNFNPHDEPDLTPIWITIYYDFSIQQITGKAYERSMVNRGCLFGFVFQCLLMDYPDIQRRYPPGNLSFSLNGVAPEIETPLQDGDEIRLMVEQNSPFDS
jgi:hypothetical protein